MMMTHKDAPPEAQMSPEWKDMIMHVRMSVGSSVLLGSDAPANFYKTPQGLTVSLGIEKGDEAKRIFKELAEAEPSPWRCRRLSAAHFGMVTDRFGIPWMVNCEKE